MPILNVTTFGFRQKCLTNRALISIAESIRYSVDNKEFGCGIFIDLKKSFWYIKAFYPSAEIASSWSKRQSL